MRSFDRQRPAVSLHGVSVLRPGAGNPPVLDFVDLDVELGEFVLVTGRSGSGKTALLEVMAGRRQVGQGKSLLHGTDLWALPRSQRLGFLAEHTGFIPEEGGLPARGDLRSAIATPAGRFRKRDPRTQQVAEELIGDLGLTEVVGRPVTEASSGERRRATVARALSHEPTLIVADDPTRGLDDVSGAAVMSLLQRWNRELGATVVVSGHEPYLFDYASKLVRMGGGRIVAESAVLPPDYSYSI